MTAAILMKLSGILKTQLNKLAPQKIFIFPSTDIPGSIFWLHPNNLKLIWIFEISKIENKIPPNNTLSTNYWLVEKMEQTRRRRKRNSSQHSKSYITFQTSSWEDYSKFNLILVSSFFASLNTVSKSASSGEHKARSTAASSWLTTICENGFFCIISNYSKHNLIRLLEVFSIPSSDRQKGVGCESSALEEDVESR